MLCIGIRIGKFKICTLDKSLLIILCSCQLKRSKLENYLGVVVINGRLNSRYINGKFYWKFDESLKADRIVWLKWTDVLILH